MELFKEGKAMEIIFIYNTISRIGRPYIASTLFFRVIFQSIEIRSQSQYT